MRYFVLVFALSLSTAQAGDIKTVEWFIAHPGIMQGLLKVCRGNPGVYSGRPNCINAEDAETQYSFRRFVRKAS